MKFEDLKLGGWYTHPEWNRHKRVYMLRAQERSSPARVVFDCGEGTYVDPSDEWCCNDASLADLTEYDEYADAKALVDMRREEYAGQSGTYAMNWSDCAQKDRNAYKSLAAKLREQGWKGAGK